MNNTTISNKKKDQEPTEQETIVAKRTMEQHSIKKQKFSFVGDPRYSVPLKIYTKEYKALKNDDFLHTNLLDYLLKAALCDKNGIIEKSDFFLDHYHPF